VVKKKKKPAEPKPAPVVITREPREAIGQIPLVDGLAPLESAPVVTPTALSSDGSSQVAKLGSLVAVGALALALLLLGLAAIPDWVIRPARASLLLAHWRVQIAASGLSALLAALVVFLIGTSGI
jgi:hypothetical protein